MQGVTLRARVEWFQIVKNRLNIFAYLKNKITLRKQLNALTLTVEELLQTRKVS